MGIGNNIKNIRKELKLSQKKFGEKLGFAQRTISGWEKESSEPDIKTIKLIAKTFNVSYDEIFEE